MNFETVHGTKQGATLEFLVSASVIEYEGRKVILAINRDITERKRLELHLRQSQKLEAIGQLAGGVAHDFNNLLGVVNGYCELLLEQLPPADPLRQKVEAIKRAGESAVAITRQLLAFGRKQMLQPQVLDLNAVVSDMERLLRRLIGEDVEVLVNPGADLGSVKVDPGQLEQVLINLAVNARDAMPQGGKLFIETCNVDLDEAYREQHPMVQPGPYVLLAVSDTGVGMDAETQTRIFEPFFTTKEKGTGLGLATVYGIIKQSGGFVWVYSEPGQGTTFKIYLPRTAAKARAISAGASVEEPLRGSETVLLVEDAEPLRQLTREFLESWGYAVIDARDAAEAIELAERHPGPIHLLLTDVVMPGMRGPGLAEHLTSRHAGMKVLYVSGYSREAFNQGFNTKNGTAFLQKPFTRQALALKVRELLHPSETPAGCRHET